MFLAVCQFCDFGKLIVLGDDSKLFGHLPKIFHRQLLADNILITIQFPHYLESAIQNKRGKDFFVRFGFAKAFSKHSLLLRAFQPVAYLR